MQLLQNDAAVYNPDLGEYDRVLCDVPCSGLGMLGKKPDLRYKDGETWAELEALQRRILATAARYVKPGGRLVYSTCTIRPEENGAAVRDFLSVNSGFSLVPPPAAPEGARIFDKMMTILPQNTGMDGFFVATLERL